MTNFLGFALLTFLAIALIIMGGSAPGILSDENQFLRGFVNHEYVNILGVIVAITTASASSIHLELRRLEAEYKFPNGFEKTRKEVRRAAITLVMLFCAGFLLALLKPYFSGDLCGQIVFNAVAIFIFFWNILILLALLRLAFKVGPIHLDEDS